MMTATSGRRLFVPSMRSGPLGSWVRMCLGSRRWYSPARRLTWAAQKIFSRKLTYTERSSGMSSTASVRTSRTRDIPSSRLLYRLVPSERRTGVTGCGLLRGGKVSDMMLKTPTAMDSTEATARMKSSQTKDGSMHSVTLARAVHTLLPTPLAVCVRHSKRVSAAKAQGSVSFRSRLNGEEAPTGLEDWLEFHGLMPSPVAQDYRRRGPNSRQQGLPELCHKLLPTHVSLDFKQKGPNARKQGLPGYFHDLLHTPIADDLKKRTNGQRRMTKRDFGEMFPENAGSQDSKDGRASQLNPLFVGEMMGYPLEWLTSPFLLGDGEGRP